MRELPLRRHAWWLVLLILLIWPLSAGAHEMRPAYLELRETEPGVFSVTWNIPIQGGMPLALTPQFSGHTEYVDAPTGYSSEGVSVQRWHMRAVDPLPGQAVRIAGLESTTTDALVRVEYRDGRIWMQRVTALEPSATIPVAPSVLSVAGTYVKLGIEHILTGFDHLLFILALIIITRGGWKLLATVTAFTVSHSITLTAATLGWVHVPPPPVEAVIALSIVFVAAEILHRRGGREGIASRAPWVVAFTFGLLHGLGFAGGLSEIGLPEGHIPTALLFFSIGVEIGHLLFVGAVLSLYFAARRMKLRAPRWASLIPPYVIGGVAMFWLIDRIAAF